MSLQELLKLKSFVGDIMNHSSLEPSPPPFYCPILGSGGGEKSMCTQMAYPPDPFISITQKHPLVSHRHQNNRMNTIKRVVIAQGIFFPLNIQKTNIHTFLHPHISHPSLKPHLHQQQKKNTRNWHTQTKTGHNKRGQDNLIRHQSVQLTFSPIHTKDIKTGARGNITLSLICTCGKHRSTEQWCAHAEFIKYKISSLHSLYGAFLVSGHDLACQQGVSLALTKLRPSITITWWIACSVITRNCVFGYHVTHLYANGIRARQTPRDEFGFLDWNIYPCNYSNETNEMM